MQIVIDARMLRHAGELPIGEITDPRLLVRRLRRVTHALIELIDLIEGDPDFEGDCDADIQVDDDPCDELDGEREGEPGSEEEGSVSTWRRDAFAFPNHLPGGNSDAAAGISHEDAVVLANWVERGMSNV